MKKVERTFFCGKTYKKSMNKKNVEIGKDVVLGKHVKIEDNVKILGESILGDGCVVRSGSRICDSVFQENCEVDSSVVDGANVGKNCHIGPFANIRKTCVIGNDVKIGAFVELKNSIIGSGCKMAHLSYVGDAILGENVNVGCGVVFANYDGKQKRQSKVGDRVFIGCNVNIVAPVNIADDTYICAGTTVTDSTNAGDFVIGRVRQENKARSGHRE